MAEASGAGGARGFQFVERLAVSLKTYNTSPPSGKAQTHGLQHNFSELPIN